MKPFLLIVAGLGLLGPANSQTLYSSSFEATQGFVSGPLNNGSVAQNGWQVVGAGGASTGSIVSGNASNGTQAVLVDSNSVLSDSYWYKNLNSASAGKIVHLTWDQKVMAPSGAPSLTNSSQFGVLAFDSAGEMLTGMLYDNFDALTYYWNFAGQQWSPFASSVPRSQYAGFGIYVNYVSGKATFEINGVKQPETSFREGTSTTFGDADIHVRFASTDSAFFDNLTVEKYSPGIIRGHVNLLEYTGLVNRPCVLELRNPGGTTPIASLGFTPDSAGNFEVATTLRGTYDLAVKGKTHLRKVNQSVVVTDEGVFGQMWTLGNGDVNNDNIVDLTDYTYIVVNFNKLNTDPSWTVVDGANVAPIDSDLNGDAVVDLSDYTTLVTAFNAVGQP